MPHTVAGSIDATLVRELCHEVRSGVHIAAISKLRTVEVTEDFRPNSIGLLTVGITQEQIL